MGRKSPGPRYFWASLNRLLHGLQNIISSGLWALTSYGPSSSLYFLIIFLWSETKSSKSAKSSSHDHDSVNPAE